MSVNYYLADELANKVIHLSKALNQAQDTISLLIAQNQCLKNVVVKLTLIDHEDVPLSSGIEQ